MDIISKINFFDGWFARHKATCGVERLDVGAEQGSEATRITLTCLLCRETIAGSVQNEDCLQVTALLSPGKVS